MFDPSSLPSQWTHDTAAALPRPTDLLAAALCVAAAAAMGLAAKTLSKTLVTRVLLFGQRTLRVGCLQPRPGTATVLSVALSTAILFCYYSHYCSHRNSYRACATLFS